MYFTRRSISVSFVGLYVLAFTFLASCQKDEINVSSSSIKIIPTENEPKQVEMAISKGGAVLVYTSSGDEVSPPNHQEFFLLNSSGDVLKTFDLSDTLFQHISIVKGIDDGFFIVGNSNTFPYIALFKVNDNGEIDWSRTFQVKFGTSKNKSAVITSRNGEYWVMHQSIGSGYYIWKGDLMGNELSNKKFPTPNAPHPGIGLNYGEWYSNVLDANDSLVVAQGIMEDEYGGVRVENAFLRTVDQNMLKKDYSSHYDSTQMEFGAGLVYVDNRIVFFGSRSDQQSSQYFGDIFVREYNTSCSLIKESLFPRVNGTPTLVRKIIPSPSGGWLMVGSNNQFELSDLVSQNNPILMRINPDLSLSWAKAINTGFPAKGYGAVHFNDGTIGLIALIKDKFRFNKLMYVHLTSNGEIINN